MSATVPCPATTLCKPFPSTHLVIWKDMVHACWVSFTVLKSLSALPTCKLDRCALRLLHCFSCVKPCQTFCRSFQRLSVHCACQLHRYDSLTKSASHPRSCKKSDSPPRKRKVTPVGVLMGATIQQGWSKPVTYGGLAPPRLCYHSSITGCCMSSLCCKLLGSVEPCPERAMATYAFHVVMGKMQSTAVYFCPNIQSKNLTSSYSCSFAYSSCLAHISTGLQTAATVVLLMNVCLQRGMLAALC